jgi:drug/metabolite transporter (DMT)-like permease
VVLAPVAALLCNAFVWGVSWWPFRQLQAMGLHPLWATVVVYVLSSAVIGAWRPDALRQVATSPALWLIFIASGATNATFNWAVSIGDVVRVVLLFYLMPLWAVLLARVVLHEPLTARSVARVVAALAGAVLVLSDGGAPEAPAAAAHAAHVAVGLPDVLALIGGFSFALNNVMLRRGAALPEEGRSLAMFLGGAAVAGVVALSLSLSLPGHGAAEIAGSAAGVGGGLADVRLPTGFAHWALPTFGLALAFLVSNLCLQYGAARLSATTTAVIMPMEVLFAALTAVWWGGAHLSMSVLWGGALILGAALASLVE